MGYWYSNVQTDNQNRLESQEAVSPIYRNLAYKRDGITIQW